MIKILHFGFTVEMATGIANQLASECSVAKELGPDFLWDTKFFTLRENPADFVETIGESNRGGVFSKIYDYIKLRSCAFDWLKRNQERYDVVLLRYSCGDFVQYVNRAWFENIFTIHHTLEIEEARLSGGIRGIIKAFFEKEFGKRVLTKTKGLIGVTNEIIRYEKARIVSEKPTFCYPNGIDLASIALINDKRGGVPKLLMVASYFAEWHGLDILLKSLKNSPEKFELHIVGKVNKSDIAFCESDTRFIFHGMRDQLYIRTISEKCDLGLSCFALERKGMTEACTLKVREYLASGLPVYAGHKDAALPDSYNYYQLGKPEANTMLNYAIQCRKTGREEIRSQAAPYIDKKILMQKLSCWLAEQLR